MVADRQQAFMRLKGTSFPLDTLKPTVKSFATTLPQAVGNTFIRPFPWEIEGLLQAMASLDILIFLDRFGDGCS